MLIQLIDSNKVLKLGYHLVKKAKNNLNLTMMIENELSTISPEYLKLLKQKAKFGVKIRRIGFGTKKMFIKAVKLIGNNNGIIFKYNSCMAIAQRLLISDEKEMLFAVYINKKDKLVFYTDSKPIIKGFIAFFDNTFDRSEFINYNLVK